MEEFCTSSSALYATMYNYSPGSVHTKRSSESSMDFDTNHFDSSLDTIPLFDNDIKLNMIDPDEFLNFDEDFTSSFRGSPSPTNSSASNHSTDSDPALSSVSPFVFETPPVSPPTQTNLMNRNSYLHCIPRTSNNLAQLQDSDSKKRVQPNPNKRTLVLPTQDFKALLKTIKNKTPPSVVLMKPTLELPCVLPKLEPVALISSVLATTPLDPALRKHQRLIKNREAAEKSRVKKKEYMSTLENDVKMLKLENLNLKTENGQLRERLKQYESFACKCRDSLMGNKSLKKNTAMVFAMLFMVSMNIGSFGNLFNFDSSQLKVDKPDQTAQHHSSRSLLWVQDNDLNKTDSRFNRTDFDSSAEPNVTITLPASCNLPLNQTENIRLENDLRKWIDELKHHNLSLNKVAEMDFGEMDNTYFVSKHLLQSFYKELHKVRKDLKKRTASRKKSGRRAQLAEAVDMTTTYKAKDHQLKVYSPSVNNYADFFDEIRRRDDTFYVVSLSGDHLLLPALAHNVTLRPKMSLMLPSTGLSNNGTFSSKFVTLMQIDCEVVNTSVIKVRERLIPEKLKSKWRGGQNGEDTSSSADTEKTIKFPSKQYGHDKNISKHESVGAKKTVGENVKPYFVDKFNTNELYQDNMLFSP